MFMHAHYGLVKGIMDSRTAATVGGYLVLATEVLKGFWFSYCNSKNKIRILKANSHARSSDSQFDKLRFIDPDFCMDDHSDF